MKSQGLGRALVVDDESPCRLFHKKLLESIGFDPVDTAASGRDALAAIQQHDYQFLLTDLHMPGMSGIELLTEVYRLVGRQGLSAIVVSSDACKGNKELAIAQGAIDLVPKPLLTASFKKMLQRIFPTSMMIFA